MVTWGTALVDLDNDMDRDLFIACGHLQDNIDHYDDVSTYLQRNILLANTGTGAFVDVSRESGTGMQVTLSSRGAGFDDLDNDGDVDVDGDIDGDSDGDTDGDSDGDTDGDMDGDGDTDSDGDSDTDSDSDSDTDSDADGDIGAAGDLQGAGIPPLGHIGQSQVGPGLGHGLHDQDSRHGTSSPAFRGAAPACRRRTAGSVR